MVGVWIRSHETGNDKSLGTVNLALKVHHLLFLDLECVRKIPKVGRGEQMESGVAVAVTYSTATQEFSFHTQDDLKPLAKQLHAADLVVGYNLPFDFKVLRGAGIRLTGVRSLDMLRPITLAAGGIVALDHVLRGTFGWKPRPSLPQMYGMNERDDWLKATEVCCNDVEGLRLIYHHVREHGWLRLWRRSATRANGSTIRRINVSWPSKPNITITPREIRAFGFPAKAGEKRKTAI